MPLCRGPGQIRVHVLDEGVQAHPGLYGPFVILAFPHHMQDLVWLENPWNSVYLESVDDVENYKEVFDDLSARALPVGNPHPDHADHQGATAVSKSNPTPPDLARSDVYWRKSSYSGGANDCVEIVDAGPWIAVRDSKYPQQQLVFERDAICVLVGAIRNQEFCSWATGRGAGPGLSR